MNNKILIIIFVAIGLSFTSVVMVRNAISSAAKYDYSKLDMLPRFAAKEYCSCIFVVKQNEDYCKEFVNPKVSLFGTRISVNWIVGTSTIEDTAAKDTRSSVLGFLRAEAEFIPNKGCRLRF